jgi:hypothetical protein
VFVVVDFYLVDGARRIFRNVGNIICVFVNCALFSIAVGFLKALNLV